MQLENLNDEIARNHFQDGLDYLAKNSFSVALHRFDLAETRLLPKNDLYWIAFIRLEKVKALKGLKEFEAAEKLILELLQFFALQKMDYALTLTLIEQAEMLELMNTHGKAGELYMRALEIAQHYHYQDLFPFLLSNLAASFTAQGLINEAIETLQRYSRLVHENSLGQAWGAKRLGDLFVTIFDYQQAIPAYLKAQDLFLRFKEYDLATQAMDSLQNLYFETGERRKQEETKRKMIEISKLHLES